MFPRVEEMKYEKLDRKKYTRHDFFQPLKKESFFRKGSPEHKHVLHTYTMS